ncbi:hypothetical protein [Staphylococcus xylosus]|uniref:hypothetical protein n=1 Tax=Staphylococcus xylosus TaxID=1288 RepID=UPI001C1E00FF|nr:hypothetical protein [Staphylococcus xylosus]MBU6132169.1 hypothetical protein [Staphylococcus xylosus]
MSTLKEICKDQRELLNECRQNIKELTEENKKLKEQIDTSQVSRLIAGNYQIKAERDTLIDDIAVLKANISRLERENEKYSEHIGELQAQQGSREYTKVLEKENLEYFKENKALRLQTNTYFDEWQNVKKQYSTLTDHIRLKAENNPGVSRYIDLVNYIDRLEDKESDTTHRIPHLTNIKVNENIEEPMKFIKRIAKERD